MLIPLSMEDRLAGSLLGTAVGDALGLAAEGMGPTPIARRFGTLDRYHMLGRTGFVSDDTEQSALVAQSMLAHPDDVGACARAFGRSMTGWLLRLPWGIGFGTLRACFKLMVGWHPSGVHTAGNGAAMRACVVGVFHQADRERRLALGRALAEVTHTDPRAVEGALYVAEVAAQLSAPGTSAPRACSAAVLVVTVPELAQALGDAMEEASKGSDLASAVSRLGNSGFVVHSVALATYCLLAHAGEPMSAIRAAIRAGGDTDTTAAIVGGWVGAARGPDALDADLVARLHDGPFGPSHLRGLARALARVGRGEPPEVVTFSVLASLTRNLALYPVILAHVLRRLVPY